MVEVAIRNSDRTHHVGGKVPGIIIRAHDGDDARLLYRGRNVWVGQRDLNEIHRARMVERSQAIPPREPRRVKSDEPRGYVQEALDSELLGRPTRSRDSRYYEDGY
jgi:hypothetical protein